jgi:hypothetical protein
MSARTSRRAPAAGLLAGVLWLVCSCAADPGTPPPAPASPVVQTVGPTRGGASEGSDDSGRRGRGGDGGGNRAAPAATLPADFPSDVPLPPGEFQAATGAAGQWSVLLRVPGSAADALRSAMQFYVASGFTSDSPSTAHRGRHTVTLVTENRDHSPTSTNLAVGVTGR